MSKKVTWKTIFPIIGDVIISPWNILIGGLLISKLNFRMASLSILFGYIILGLIFYFYGRLGFKYSKKTSELIEPIFGKKGTKYIFSIILALGQIGWFALITEIGGSSIAGILGLSNFVGIIIFAAGMYFMAIMSLYKLGIVKAFITISSLCLILYLIVQNFNSIDFIEIWNDTNKSGNMLWGVSVIVSSLISFSTVTPDFFSQLKSNRDTVLTIIWGLFIPGIIITILGSIFFFRKTSLSFDVLIGASFLSMFGHIFNIITNTDASIAIYTPGNRLEYIFNIPFKYSVLIATCIGTILSLIGITERLESWLMFLSSIFPIIISITCVYYFTSKKNVNHSSLIVSLLSIILLSLSFIFPIYIILWIGLLFIGIIYYLYIKYINQ